MFSSGEEQSKRFPESLFVHRRLDFQEVLHGYGTKLWVFFSQPEELFASLSPVRRGGRGWHRSLHRRLQLDRHNVKRGERLGELAAAHPPPGRCVRVYTAG